MALTDIPPITFSRKGTFAIGIVLIIFIYFFTEFKDE